MGGCYVVLQPFLDSVSVRNGGGSGKGEAVLCEQHLCLPCSSPQGWRSAISWTVCWLRSLKLVRQIQGY